jgi:hypothetical protein
MPGQRLVETIDIMLRPAVLGGTSPNMLFLFDELAVA